MHKLIPTRRGWLGLSCLIFFGLISWYSDILKSSWLAITQWLVLQHRQLYRLLGEHMQSLPEQLSAGHVGLIFLICFAYGALHAAGPGHGKVVITAYLFSHPSRLWTGLKLSLAAALLQGLTAVAIISLFVIVLGWVAREMLQYAQGLELASFFAIALLGGLLSFRAGRLLLQHAHLKLRSRFSFNALTPIVAMPQRSAHATECSLCSHAHHIAPEQWLGSTRWQQMGLVASVGLRPCTGALFILMMANFLGFWWVGLLGVFAMSIGTALTVAVLALLSVQTRSWLIRWLALQPQSLPVFTATAALTGGLVLTLFGLSLGFGAWLSPPQIIGL